MIAKTGHPDSGVGRYVAQLKNALEALGHQVVLVHPVVPLPNWLLKLLKNTLGWDLFEFFNNFPIWIRYPEADIYHFSSQNLATLLTFCSPQGSIVTTVHDIIPLLRGNHDNYFGRIFYRLAVRNLNRSVYLISVSRHTKQNLINHLNIDKDKIQVVYEGVISSKIDK